jgi:membrane protease YdiL (CAAX protease family)
MLGLLFVTLAGTASGFFASRPELAGQPRLWLLLFASEVPLLLLALYFLRRDGVLKARLAPKPGDVLRGVSLAAILVIGIWSCRALLMPRGSIREAWLARLYIHLGDPVELGRIWWVPLVVVGWALSEEVVWRAWVQPKVIERFGPLRGILITALAYGVQALPVGFNLSDPYAGYNNMVVLLTLGVGLTWGYITYLMNGRVTPSLISHAMLAYFTLLEFRPGL